MINIQFLWLPPYGGTIWGKGCGLKGSTSEELRRWNLVRAAAALARLAIRGEYLAYRQAGHNHQSCSSLMTRPTSYSVTLSLEFWRTGPVKRRGNLAWFYYNLAVPSLLLYVASPMLNLVSISRVHLSPRSTILRHPLFFFINLYEYQCYLAHLRCFSQLTAEPYNNVYPG